MRHHINVLGLLHMVWGVFAALTGVSLAILAAGTYAAVNAGAAAAPVADTLGSSAAVWLLGVTGGFLFFSGIALVTTGRRLRATQSGARLAALLLALPNLLILPFGTALGVYTYWVLLNNDARDAFGRPQRSAAI